MTGSFAVWSLLDERATVQSEWALRLRVQLPCAGDLGVVVARVLAHPGHRLCSFLGLVPRTSFWAGNSILASVIMRTAMPTSRVGQDQAKPAVRPTTTNAASVSVTIAAL